MFGNSGITGRASDSGTMHSSEAPTSNVVETKLVKAVGVKFMVNGLPYAGSDVLLKPITKNGKHYFKAYGRTPIVDNNGNIIMWNVVYSQELEITSASGQPLNSDDDTGYLLPDGQVQPFSYLMSGAPPVRPKAPAEQKQEEQSEGKTGQHGVDPKHQDRPVDGSSSDTSFTKYGRDVWEHYGLTLYDEDSNDVYEGPIHVEQVNRNGRTYLKILGATPQTNPSGGAPVYSQSFHHTLVPKNSSGHVYNVDGEGYIEVPENQSANDWFQGGMQYSAPRPATPVKPRAPTIVSQTTSTPFHNHNSSLTFINTENMRPYVGTFKVVYTTMSDGSFRLQYQDNHGIPLQDMTEILLSWDEHTHTYTYRGDNPQEYVRERYQTFKTISDLPQHEDIVRQYDYSHTYRANDIKGIRWKVHDNLYLNNQTDIHAIITENNDRTKTIQFYIYDKVGDTQVRVPIEAEPVEGYTLPFSSPRYREYTLPSDLHQNDLNSYIRGGMGAKLIDDPEDGKGKEDDGKDDDNKNDDDSKDNDDSNPDDGDNKDPDTNPETPPPVSPAHSVIFDRPDTPNSQASEDNTHKYEDGARVVGFLLMDDEFFDDIFEPQQPEILGFCMYQDGNNENTEAQEPVDDDDSILPATGRRCLQEFGADSCGGDEVKPMPIPTDEPLPNDEPDEDNHKDEIPPDDDDVTPQPTEQVLSSGVVETSEYVPPPPVQRQSHAYASAPILTAENIDYEIPEQEKDKLKDFVEFYDSSLAGEEANDEIFEETFSSTVEEDDPMVEEWFDKEPTQEMLDDWKWNSVFAQIAYIDKEARVSKFYGFEYDEKLSTDDIAIYRNPKLNRIMVSFRGTELGDLGKSVVDVINDLFIATSLERYSLRFRRSYDFVKKLQDENPKAKITLSSHSLGASISTYCGKRLPNVDVYAYGTGTGLPFIEELLSGSEKTIENLSNGNPLFKIFIDTMFAEQGSSQDNNIKHIRYFSDLLSVGRRFKTNSTNENDITLRDNQKLLVKAHSISNFVDKKYRKVALPIGSKLQAKYDRQEKERLKHVHP